MGCKWCTSGLGRKCEGLEGGDDIHASCTCECHSPEEEQEYEDG